MEYELQIIELKEEARIGDLTNLGLFYDWNYLTPLSYTEKQFHIYSCEDKINSRIKPIKIKLFLKKGDVNIEVDRKLSFELWRKFKNKIVNFKEGIDFKIFYGINYENKRWECFCKSIK